MKFKESIAVQNLVQEFKLELIKDDTGMNIQGMNEIHKVEKGDLTFVDVEKYYEKVLTSNATFIIINSKIECPEGKCLLYSENPFLVYNQIAKNNFPKKEIPNACISDTATIGKNTEIYPNVIIGNNVIIGDNCIIYPNVTIYDNTIIGNNVILHANSSIGKDAFYYNRQGKEYKKMHTIGYTLIKDDVEIGSNCSIDSGVSGVTTIGKGTKIDNQVHIGHGVILGDNCLLCAQVAIAGKTTIGNNCVLYGKVGISKGLNIGDGSIILACSNVNKDLIGNQKYYGTPAEEARVAMKSFAALKLLPNLMEKMKHLINEKDTIDN